MSPLQVINAGLALTIEVCMLWAYGAWGFRVGEGAVLHWSMMLVAVAVGIVLWAIWAAPKSRLDCARRDCTYSKRASFFSLDPAFTSRSPLEVTERALPSRAVRACLIPGAWRAML